MSDRYLAEINAKIIRSKKIDFNELQCVSMYGHNETDDLLKSAKINDDDNLKVTDYGNELTTLFSGDEFLLGVSYTTPAIPVKKNKNIIIYVEAPDDAADINHITLNVEVSNVTNYYELDSHYLTSHKNDHTIQAEVTYYAKNIKITLDNNKGSNLNNISLYVYQ